MPLPTLNIQQIVDLYVRENFKNLLDFFRSQTPLMDFGFLEIKLDRAQDKLKYPHNLGYTPKDLIQLSLTGKGVVTWDYSSFDKNSIVLSATDACTVRILVGTYNGNK